MSAPFACIGDLALSPRTPRIVAPFFRRVESGVLRELRGSGLDAAEIRLDMAGCETPDAAADFLRGFVGAGLPLIVTARSAREGGEWRGGEDARLEVLIRALEFADAVDVELNSAGVMSDMIWRIRTSDKTALVSCHNFSGTDSRREMEDLLDYARHGGAHIFKIACVVRDESESARMLDFVRKHCDEFPLIATAMGEGDIARRTRLELAQNGSLVAFASADGASAPGQWTLAETVAALRKD